MIQRELSMGKIRFGIIGTNFITDRFMEGIEKVEDSCVLSDFIFGK